VVVKEGEEEEEEEDDEVWGGEGEMLGAAVLALAVAEEARGAEKGALRVRIDRDIIFAGGEENAGEK